MLHDAQKKSVFFARFQFTSGVDPRFVGAQGTLKCSTKDRAGKYFRWSVPKMRIIFEEILSLVKT
jgi:hypothetical protein